MHQQKSRNNGDFYFCFFLTRSVALVFSLMCVRCTLASVVFNIITLWQGGVVGIDIALYVPQQHAQSLH